MSPTFLWVLLLTLPLCAIVGLTAFGVGYAMGWLACSRSQNRIAELDRRIADIDRQLAELDGEEGGVP